MIYPSPEANWRSLGVVHCFRIPLLFERLGAVAVDTRSSFLATFICDAQISPLFLHFLECRDFIFGNVALAHHFNTPEPTLVPTPCPTIPEPTPFPTADPCNPPTLIPTPCPTTPYLTPDPCDPIPTSAQEPPPVPTLAPVNPDGQEQDEQGSSAPSTGTKSHGPAAMTTILVTIMAMLQMI